MKTSNPIRYVTVQFIHFTTSLMISLGLLLRKAVEEAGPLPAPYTHTWKPFFEAVEILELAVAAEVRPPPEAPENGDALEVVKNGVRTLHGFIAAFTHSPIVAWSEAATTLYAELFPEGLDVITEAHYDVVGWTAIALRRLETIYASQIEVLNGQKVVQQLKDTFESYRTIAGRPSLEPPSIGELPTPRKALDNARLTLGNVMIDLSHLALHRPELTPMVQGMLRPLDELTDRVRADRKRKAKAEANSGGGNANDASNGGQASNSDQGTGTPSNNGSASSDTSPSSDGSTSDDANTSNDGSASDGANTSNDGSASDDANTSNDGSASDGANTSNDGSISNGTNVSNDVDTSNDSSASNDSGCSDNSQSSEPQVSNEDGDNTAAAS